MIGNHESGAGNGYFDYFNGVGARRPRRRARQGLLQLRRRQLASDRAQLELQPASVGCSAGSAQEQWLRADLAATRAPARSPTGTTPASAPGTTATTHVHAADVAGALRRRRRRRARRAQPQLRALRTQDANGGPDRSTASASSSSAPAARTSPGSGRPIANSEVSQNNTFGVLKLTLHPTSYDWQFVPTRARSGPTRARGIATVRRGLRSSLLLHPGRRSTAPRRRLRTSGPTAPLQAPHGVPLHPLGAGVRAVRPRAPPCRSALSAGREVHASRDSGDQHASVPLRRGRQASQAWQVQGQGRGSRSRWQLLHAGESEGPDRSLTSLLARSTLAAGPASQGR